MGGMFSLLPDALSELCNRPALAGTLLDRVFAPDPEESDTPLKRTLVLVVVRPVAEMRIRMISRMTPDGALEKIGEAFGGKPIAEQAHYGRTLTERIRRDFDLRAENFAPMTARDRHGNVAVTAPCLVRNAAVQTAFARALDLPSIAGSALALGAVAAEVCFHTKNGPAPSGAGPLPAAP